MSLKAKDFLLQLKKLDRLIENKEFEKQQWKDIATSITVQTTGERVQSSGSKDKIANAVVRYVEIENEINQQIDKYIKVKEDIINVIEQLDYSFYDLLHKVYVQGKALNLASYEMGNSESWGTTMHGRALQKVQLILDEREKNERIPRCEL
jgi:archaellum component FlaC